MWNLHILPDHGKVVPPCFRLSYVTKSCLDIILWLDSCLTYLNSAPPSRKRKKTYHLKNDGLEDQTLFYKEMVPPFKMTFVLFSLGFPPEKGGTETIFFFPWGMGSNLKC